jgi:hypothetical protein
MTTISAHEARTLLSKPKRSKYGAKKTVLDGITYDSKAEAAYAAQLKVREKAGEVGGIDVHRRFAIFGPDGQLLCTYVGDFTFWDHVQGRLRCVDVKGGKATQTAVFKLKKKLMKSFLGIDVEVVT